MFPIKLIEKLEKLASQECACDDDDFNPMDASGGNYDDAYWMGYADGQAKLAKEIMAN